MTLAISLMAAASDAAVVLSENAEHSIAQEGLSPTLLTTLLGAVIGAVAVLLTTLINNYVNRRNHKLTLESQYLQFCRSTLKEYAEGLADLDVFLGQCLSPYVLEDLSYHQFLEKSDAASRKLKLCSLYCSLYFPKFEKPLEEFSTEIAKIVTLTATQIMAKKNEKKYKKPCDMLSAEEKKKLIKAKIAVKSALGLYGPEYAKKLIK